MDATTITSTESLVASLQQQLHAVEDALGQSAGTWRKLAAQPGAAAREAARLGDLERQQDLLRAALAQAQQTQTAEVEQSADAADDERLRDMLPLATTRAALGKALDDAVNRVADLMHELSNNADSLQAFEPLLRARRQRGLTVSRMPELKHAIQSTLMRRLGADVWPTELRFGGSTLDRSFHGKTIASEIGGEAMQVEQLVDGTATAAPAALTSEG